MTIDPLPDGSEVKIYTLSGDVVKSLGAYCNCGKWDLTNDSGHPVASGYYLYVVKDAQGRRTSGSFVVVR